MSRNSKTPSAVANAVGFGLLNTLFARPADKVCDVVSVTANGIDRHAIDQRCAAKAKQKTQQQRAIFFKCHQPVAVQAQIALRQRIRGLTATHEPYGAAAAEEADGLTVAVRTAVAEIDDSREGRAGCVSGGRPRVLAHHRGWKHRAVD